MSLFGADPLAVQQQMDRLEQRLNALAARQEEILGWLGSRLDTQDQALAQASSKATGTAGQQAAALDTFGHQLNTLGQEIAQASSWAATSAGHQATALGALGTRLDAMAQQLAELPAGLAETLAARQAGALSALEGQVQHVSRRQEEILAWMGARLNRVMDAQSIYLGDHTALTFLETGQRIYVDTRDIGIGAHLLTQGRWESNYTSLFRRLVKPGHTVFDIGANHGVYTLFGAGAAGPGGHVHAFEANPRLARLTAMSAALNGYGGIVTMHQLAVGEAEGTARLVFDHGWSGGGSLFGQEDKAGGGNEGVACRVAALDALFPQPDFQVQVLKMDIEGAEGCALMGMPALLERSRDIRMMLEFAPEMLASSGIPASHVAEFLAARGFRAWSIGADSALTPAPWGMLAATERGVQNILVSRDEPF